MPTCSSHLSSVEAARRVAVSATEPTLTAPVDPRLGRCAYFVILDIATMNFEVMSNDANAQGGGAGVQSAKALAMREVDAILTGNCGPNAYATLTAAGIAVVTGCGGTVLEVVQRFKAGELRAATSGNFDKHSGGASG